MSQSIPHVLEYGQTCIEYQLAYTGRETLAIHVHPDTQVTVEAPMGSDFTEIERRLWKRAAWILRQQCSFRRYSFDIPPRQYVSGETHRYLGRQYQLKVIQSEDGKEFVKMDREHILVCAKDKNDPVRVKKLLIDWYRLQAKKVFSERLKVWIPHLEHYNIKQPKILIREMRSRWGSYSATGKMTLNLKLIMVPKQFIDYLIVHECCHMIEHNHSQAFYTLISKVMPGWEEQRKKLNGFEF
jgi:predicted metal-dependent hydrolase